jgi:hypothetical protein
MRQKKRLTDELIDWALKNFIPLLIGVSLLGMQITVIPGGLSPGGLRYWINFFSGVKQISNQQLADIQKLEWSTPVHVKTQLKLTQEVNSVSYNIYRTRGSDEQTRTDLIAADLGDKILLVRRDSSTFFGNFPFKPLKLNTSVNMVGALVPIPAFDSDNVYRGAIRLAEEKTGKPVLPFMLEDYNDDESRYYHEGRGAFFMSIFMATPLVLVFLVIKLLIWISFS